MRPWIPYAALALVAFLAWQHYAADLRNQGALKERIAGLETRNARLEDEAGRIDTLYIHDTLRLTVTRRVTDSILRVDTVFSRERVTQIVEGERQACSAVISTCERAKANLVAQLANRDSVIAAKDKQRPGFVRRNFACAAGVAATTTGAGLGVACGVRLP